MKNTYNNKSSLLPILSTVLLLIVSFYSIFEFTEYAQHKKTKTEREKVYELLSTKKSRLEKALYSRIYYTKGVAAYISLNPEINHLNFQELAHELIQNDSLINTMSIAKDGVISSIYPYKGHEEAVGLDLLSHPARREIVEKTIETHNTFVAGPVELVEGGIAFVSYTPIFYKNGERNGDFWGVTDIVVRRDMLFREAGLENQKDILDYSVKGHDGLGAAGNVIWGDSTVFAKDPVTIQMVLPTGSWLIAATPKAGWEIYGENEKSLLMFLYFSAVIISLLIGLLVKTYLRVIENEKQLKAMFGAMKDIVIEYNLEGVYLNIAPTNESLLVKPRSELLGKSVYDVLEKNLADTVILNIKNAIQQNTIQIFDYPLEINNKKLWFQGRVSKISNDRALLVSHDNTERTLAVNKIKESEAELKKSNALKDKFFSIIAHDLKSPIGSFSLLTDTLRKDYDSFEDNERKEFIELLNNSSKNLVNLIENLLQWSRSQKGDISFAPEATDLSFIAENVKNTLSISAEAKGIHIVNEISSGSFANIDVNMITTVIRNLVSNAVKYTNQDGSVLIRSKLSEAYVEVSIEDNGIGMSEDVKNKLFKLASAVSMPGTNNENGTGLGLILCREFVEKHGGNIGVESTPGKGSRFFFTLPIS